MKGLLLKDLHMLKGYFMPYLFLFCVFSLVGVFANMTPLLVAGASLLPSIGVGCLSLDERFKWDIYCDTMPVSRDLFVVEKYVLSLFCALFCAAVTFVLALIKGSTGEALMLAELVLMVAMALPSLYYPVMFALGSEKSRAVQILLVLAVVVIITLALSLVDGIIWLSMLMIVPILLYFLSMFISCRIYRRKEL